MEYVLKTTDPSEVSALLALLPRYVDYVEAHADDTLLPRYLDLLTLEREGTRVTLVIMANVFAGHHRILRRFDVKGATYGRAASESERAKGATATFKDVDLLSLGEPMRLVDTKARERLVAAAARDADWLASCGLLDYSLLIGLAHQRGDATAPLSRHVRAFAITPVPITRSEGADEEADEEDEEEGWQLEEVVEGAAANLAYVGIVDILMSFNATKRVEAVLLGLVLGDISCQPPRAYASRFAGFMRHIFVAAPSAGSAGGACETGITSRFARQWLDRPGASAVWPLSAWHWSRRDGSSCQGAEFGKKDVLLALSDRRRLLQLLAIGVGATGVMLAVRGRFRLR
eukprot:1126386-Prymnesium_polylepis.2